MAFSQRRSIVIAQLARRSPSSAFPAGSTFVRRDFGFDQFELATVFFGVLFGVLTHLLDLVVRQAGRLFDADRGFLGCCQVTRRHVQDTVLVNVEFDFDLRNTAGAGGMPSRLNSPSSRL